MTKEDYHKKLIEAGHVLETDEDGNQDNFAYEIGFHNGPRCVNCGQGWCHHCLPEICPCSSVKN